jgi:hypothetical protein
MRRLAVYVRTSYVLWRWSVCLICSVLLALFWTIKFAVVTVIKQDWLVACSVHGGNTEHLHEFEYKAYKENTWDLGMGVMIVTIFQAQWYLYIPFA